MQAHDGLSARIAAEAVVERDGETCRFDGLWISSLADSASRAQPDEEVIDLGSRLSSLAWTLEATDLPVVFDGDTGGSPQQAAMLLRRLARLGVAAVVFEDQAGHKRNSLGPGHRSQGGLSVAEFCTKLQAAAGVRPPGGPLLVARIESLIRGDGVEDVVVRARAFVEAGADAILVHGASTSPDPVLNAVRGCRAAGVSVPIFVVPTAFGTVHEQELADAGVDVVVYANQLLRSAIVAMKKTAQTLLGEGRAAAADGDCFPVCELLQFIRSS